MHSSTTLSDIRRSVLNTVIPCSAIASRRDHAQRPDRIVEANRYCDQFFGRMLSEKRYATEAEAINSMAPIAIWFIGWATRQFAIAVIRCLWRHWSAVESEAKTPRFSRVPPPT